MIKRILGQNIRKYRKRASLNQDELAEKLEISPKHLSNIEVGTRFISAKLLERISNILNVSPSALFFSPDIDKKDENFYGTIDRLISEQSDLFVRGLKDKIREET